LPNKGTKSVTIEEASQIVSMSPTTTVCVQPFFLGLGVLKKGDGGGFIPAPDALSYLSAYEWDQKTAAQKIGPRLRDTWFGEALLPRLAYGQAIDETLAVNILAEAAGASPDYERELRMLIEFLAIAGVVQREGGQIKPVRVSGAPDEAPGQQRIEEEPHMDVDATAKTGRAVKTTYAAQSTPSPGGGFDFSVSVHVDMAEFGGWKPERINAFFRGIAEVLAAKADIERGGTGS
jgi:hypothetical protein